MADYFLMLDAAAFEGRIRPALAASRRSHGFDPCRSLCAELVPAARAYAEHYHVGGDEPMPARVAAGLPFDRDYWRAWSRKCCCVPPSKSPNFRPAKTPFVCCWRRDRSGKRHHGTRDLTFGAAVTAPITPATTTPATWPGWPTTSPPCGRRSGRRTP